jgi:hypothetical protein
MLPGGLRLKGGATFCLAMISIGSGLKPRASQRCRNNCLTLEMENGAPADFLGEPRPPTMRCPGVGDGERSHGPRLNNIAYMIYIYLLAQTTTAFAPGSPSQVAPVVPTMCNAPIPSRQ